MESFMPRIPAIVAKFTRSAAAVSYSAATGAPTSALMCLRLSWLTDSAVRWGFSSEIEAFGQDTADLTVTADFLLPTLPDGFRYSIATNYP